MENQFGGFDQQAAGFGDFAGFDAGENTPTVDATATAPVTTTGRNTIGDVPLSQISGLQNGKYSDLDKAKDAILALPPEELQRRKENGLAFRWIKTIVDKVDYTTDENGKRKLKPVKFLGWQVVTNDTNGTPTIMTDAQLLSYITAHCPQSGKIGTGAEGLQLRHAVRENKSSKGGNFTNSIVISLVPAQKGVSKYQEDKLLPAKTIVYEEDGVTPVLVNKPGAKKDSTKASDKIVKYDWISEEYRQVFGTKRSSREKKKDLKSQEAFEILVYMNGLRDESIYM